jgi:hypothetical protein
MVLAGCDNGSTDSGGDTTASEPKVGTYTSIDAEGNTYNLVITEKTRAVYAGAVGDTFVLTITPSSGPARTSSGTISLISGGRLTLQPSGATATFTVTIASENLTAISGTLTFTTGAPETVVGDRVLTPTPPTGGTDGDVWAILLGTWKSDDGKLEYEFKDVGGGAAKMVTVTGYPPYEQWLYFFFVVTTVTRNEISGGSASFEFVLSDNNQTLTVSEFFLKEDKASHTPGPLNFNGVLKKQ